MLLGAYVPVMQLQQPNFLEAPQLVLVLVGMLSAS